MIIEVDSMEIINNTGEGRSGESDWIQSQQLVAEEISLGGALKVTQAPTEPGEANLSEAAVTQNT